MASQNSAIARYWPAANLGAFVVVCSGYWLKKLKDHVAEPYMDEIFHVPQAQQYCSGNYFDWDPKLTTPPGLYAVSMLLKSVLPISFWPGKGWPRDSRPFVEKEGVDVLSKAAGAIFDTGCHISELRSLGVLILGLMFLVCWQIRRTVQTRAGDDWWLFSEPAATAANICMFPPLFFFSGLYYTDVLSTFVVLLAYWALLWRMNGGRSKKHNMASGLLVYVIGVAALAMRQTNIFWVGIFLAGLEWECACERINNPMPFDLSEVGEPNYGSLTGLSNYISYLYKGYAGGKLHNPPTNLSGPFDYLHCLLSMTVYAVNNPILLITHLWPFISLLTTFAAFVFWNGGVVLGDKSNHVATIHLPQLLYLLAFTAFFSFPLLLLDIWGIIKEAKKGYLPYPSSVLWLLSATGVALATVHYNTIIHPFTLADNRHYMFYIFRYTILRHPAIKYLLCPLYIFAGYIILCTLGGQTANLDKDEKRQTKSGPTTAWTTVFMLATALSLITAPLVEPRYFIIPWVMWRLHVASYTEMQEKIMSWTERMWFLAINVATCWIFLNKPFEWPSEPGVAQRFMW